MRIRHIVAADNVDADGWVRDAAVARHALLVGGRVAALSGPVDAATHLNRDFPDHRMEECIVVASLAVGAAVCMEEDGFAVAAVPRAAFRAMGRVDQGARREAWMQGRNAQATAEKETP